MKLRTHAAALALSLATAAAAPAAILNTFTTGDGSPPNDTTIDQSVITGSNAPNVSGTTTGAQVAAGGVAPLTRFNNDNSFIDVASNSGTTLDMGEFGGGYFTFSVSAASGFTLDLTSLTFDAARGGDSGTRGYEVYGDVNGAPIDFGTDLLSKVVNETGTRPAPASRTVALADPKFLGADSATFRIYTLSDNFGRTVGFRNVAVNGEVTAVPEPASLAAAAGLGGLLLGRRRRD